MPLLKWPLPEDILQLSAGASIIIVIPPTSKVMSSVVHAQLEYYSGSIDPVIEASCVWMKNACEHALVVDKCSRSHHIQCNGAIALQYHVRVSNYAKCALFKMESPNKS